MKLNAASSSDPTIELPASLRFERHDTIGILRLARPHKRNALDDITIQGIEDFFSATLGDIKAIVIHGEGEHFCAGLDLSELSERDIPAGIADARPSLRAFGPPHFAPSPSVAFSPPLSL